MNGGLVWARLQGMYQANQALGWGGIVRPDISGGGGGGGGGPVERPANNGGGRAGTKGGGTERWLCQGGN